MLARWPDGQLLHNLEPRVPTLRRNEYVLAHLLLQSTPKSEFSVPDLCRRIGTSPARFYRLFEATTGLAPLAYFNRMLARRAARLIRSQAGSVKAVSLELGFRCESQFSRLFRHYHGVAPERYRQAKVEGFSPRTETLREISH
jgi:AraC-like DNA-binding protein